MSSDRSSLLRGDSSQLPFQADRRLHAKTQADRKPVQESNAYKHDQSNPSSKGKQNPPARKIAGKATRTNPVSAPSKDALEHTKARLDVKVNNGSGPFGGATMTEAIQRRCNLVMLVVHESYICLLRCKNVIPKIQRRIDKEGLQMIPLLTDLRKITGSQGSSAGNSLLDLRKIELRVERLKYNGVMELIADVQAMLKVKMQYFEFSH
ncbi:ATP-dependent helicase BRM [Tanacetum coccineum]